MNNFIFTASLVVYAYTYQENTTTRPIFHRLSPAAKHGHPLIIQEAHTAEIARVGWHYVVQGDSRSLILVPVESRATVE